MGSESHWLDPRVVDLWRSHQDPTGIGYLNQIPFRHMSDLAQREIGTLDQGPILDLGSGSGPSIYLSNKILKRTYALDLSLPMLRFNPSQGRVCADLNQPLHPSLPFASDSFVAVTSFLSFRYCDLPFYLVLESLRVLTPGGKLIIIDLFFPYRFSLRGALGEKSYFRPRAILDILSPDDCDKTTSRIEVITERGDVQCLALILTK